MTLDSGSFAALLTAFAFRFEWIVDDDHVCRLATYHVDGNDCRFARAQQLTAFVDHAAKDVRDPRTALAARPMRSVNADVSFAPMITANGLEKMPVDATDIGRCLGEIFHGVMPPGSVTQNVTNGTTLMQKRLL